MIYYNFLKSALEEIWYDYKKNILMRKRLDNTVWNLFINILFTIIIFTLFSLLFIPIDIILSPLEIVAAIYYYFIDKKYK